MATDAELVKKLLAFYIAKRFIAILTLAHDVTNLNTCVKYCYIQIFYESLLAHPPD